MSHTSGFESFLNYRGSTINFKLKPNYEISHANPTTVGLNFTLYDSKRPKSKHNANQNIIIND